METAPDAPVETPAPPESPEVPGPETPEPEVPAPERPEEEGDDGEEAA